MKLNSMNTENTIKNMNKQTTEQKMTTIMLSIINKASDTKSVKNYFKLIVKRQTTEKMEKSK